jgi:hypothetical protein
MSMPKIQTKARALSVPPSARWPWLNKIAAAWLLVMLALFLGVLSFAAVREMSVQCRDEASYVLTANGDHVLLVDGISRLESAQKQRKCRLAWGDAF